jgi:hypothetical protein
MRRRERRSKGITTKVTTTDYEKCEARAGGQSVSEWTRGVIQKELAGPDPFQLAVMEAFATLRYVLFNGLPWLAPEHLVTTDPKAKRPREVLLIEETFRRLIYESEHRAPEKAKALLKAGER